MECFYIGRLSGAKGVVWPTPRSTCTRGSAWRSYTPRRRTPNRSTAHVARLRAITARRPQLRSDLWGMRGLSQRSHMSTRFLDSRRGVIAPVANPRRVPRREQERTRQLHHTGQRADQMFHEGKFPEPEQVDGIGPLWKPGERSSRSPRPLMTRRKVRGDLGDIRGLLSLSPLRQCRNRRTGPQEGPASPG